MKRLALIVAMTMTIFIAHAQRTFDDLIGRKLTAVGYAWPDKLDNYGKPKMYGMKSPLTWQFNSDGTLLWRRNEDKTFRYTLNDSTVTLTNANPAYSMKLFIPWPDQRDSPNYKAYITAQNNEGRLYYFTLSKQDCYELYEKALEENRLYAAYDYMCLVWEVGDCFAECALGYLEETIDDFPGDGNGIVRYLSAEYGADETPEDNVERSKRVNQILVDNGFITKEQADAIAVPSMFFLPNDEQRQWIKSFASQRAGVFDISVPSNGDEEERIANVSAAVESFQKAINTSNDAVSNFYLGKIYYEGLLGFKEKKNGLKYIEAAAAQGSALANCYLGNLKKEEGDIDTARKLWQKAANAQLQRPQVRISTLSSLVTVNPDMSEVRFAVKEAKNNLKKYTK